ncbi:flagellar hook capping FlgD N-terminal domain-containing protein [Nibricoccus sp. IMCC34717]|uniref:flagellar hook capping FlgD N-terminal domain-containing protein n=1 Tax=Nibricoccus sp. IMCC34717 TaxID=3034021 RepID=UPI00384BF9F7
MSVSSITSTNSSSADSSTAAARVPQKVLGQKDFLKLIATQMTHQDPMKPMEDTAFIAQMAQFSSLENSQKMLDQFSTLRSSNELSLARSLIGQNVTVFDMESQKEVTGTVDGVGMDKGTTSLEVGGKTYDLAMLRRVTAQPPASPSSTSSASSNSSSPSS